jgi:D-sedoheptulose 7-phosphate isomerase
MPGISEYLDESARLLAAAAREIAALDMERAVSLCCESIRGGGSLLVCGNGGSAADAMHITGELVGRFLRERRALRAICLSDNPAILTAWSNDYSYDTVFSRQVEAYGSQGAVLIGISTSGNSPNVVKAAETAREMGMHIIALTGRSGGGLARRADVTLRAPADATPMIQQVHICLYHYLCAEIEARLTDEA